MLGSKFCAQPKGTQWKDKSRMMNRFKRDPKLENYLITSISDSYEDVPRMHRKNEKWKPPRAIVTRESC